MINIFAVKPQGCEFMVSGPRALDDIAAAMRAGDSAGAAAMAEAVLAQGIIHPLLFQARALHLDKIGRHEEALTSFLKARELAPQDPMTAGGVAICLGRMGRLAESLHAFQAALALDPDLATTYFHMGWILEMNQDFPGACRAYAQATDRAPRYTAAWAGLAASAQATQDWTLAKSAATQALSFDPEQPRAVLALAMAENHDGAFGSAEIRLRAALNGAVPPPLRMAMLGVLADALDGQDKIAEAFAFYEAENLERLKASPPPKFDAIALARELTGYVERNQFAPGSAASETREHIFLLGFPRSGTTLLEQVLSAHQDVVTLEESDVLDSAAELFLAEPSGIERFAALDEAKLLRLREEYWQRVRAHGVGVSGKVFVDKLPLNTLKLPLIAGLFPGAKIIFAVRDPRDVVFSCFRRHFQVNASTYPFLTLEGTARFYDAVMALGEISRVKLPQCFYRHRHEDLVADFAGETRRLCAFLNLEWAPGLESFAAAARTRAIRSISAAQVRQGLNSNGCGLWRRYAAQLAPVLPILRPWIAHFGYSES
jgi:Flp pilus assembly protein TadD